MNRFLPVLLYIAIGIIIAIAMNKGFYPNASMVICIMLSLVGSLGLCWLVGLMNLGGGITVVSLWGVIGAILGAALLTWLYCYIQNRRSQKIEGNPEVIQE